MGGLFRHWYRFLVRHPGWTLGAALLLGLSGYLLWQGACALWFHQDLAHAKRAIAAYDFAAGRSRLAQCIRLRPRDPAVRLLAAQTARRDGDLEAAEQQLDVYRELAGALTPQGTLELALLKAQRGLVKEVVDYLISCLEVHHPASEQILEALAWGSISVYRLDQGRFWIQELLEKAPKNPIGRLLRAEMAETMGNEERALEGFRELVAEYPQQTYARLHLAVALFKLQKFEEAAAQYEELRRQQPDQAQPWLGLARCWKQLGRTDELRPQLRQLEEQFPDNSDVLLECGQFALHDQRLADAERLLRRAVQLDPDDRETHYQLGVCLHALNRPDESQRHMQRFKQIEADMMRLEKMFEATVKAPADPVPRLEAGQICLRNGQTKEGLRWLYGVLDIDPKHKPTHAVLADYFGSQGDSLRADYHRQLAR
jgi:tetratricopeptide (TPR) repeat protein